MEVMAVEIDASHFGIGNLETGGISVGIDLATDFEAGVGGSGGDQLNDDLMADEGPAAPVLCDQREQAVLDLVPLAGAGR